MTAEIAEPDVMLSPQARLLQVGVTLRNAGAGTWSAESSYLGWQVFDPETGRFLLEGTWEPLGRPLPPGESTRQEVRVALPPMPGGYHVYVAPIVDGAWSYADGGPLLLLDAVVQDDTARLERAEVTTLRRVRRRRRAPARRLALTLPFAVLWRHAALLRSLVRRDILARYRGSLGGALWTLLHPLLLMATYAFVFGVVLEARFAGDPSRSGFVLYFLAGMLPWLAISEALGRAATVIPEHANIVKKVVFPLETLPAKLALAGLVTQGVAGALFLVGLAVARGGLPWSVLGLPLLVVPQALLTLGLCWLLAGLGVFARDLGQLMGFLLTLVFFLTPICYPEASLPAAIAPWLLASPVYALVRGYREVLLEGRLPDAGTLGMLWVLGLGAFVGGHAWFHKLRRMFADVL